MNSKCDHLQNNKLLLIIEKNYSFNLLFDFCEILIDKAKNSGHILKYFIGKIDRKLKIKGFITSKLMDYIFNKYQIERTSINILQKNESIYQEIKRELDLNLGMSIN